MPRRKALKVIVDVTINAVTCPGVILPDHSSVFLNVDIFGECQKTEYLPAVFPFLYHEKMRFEKTFHQATDPVQVAKQLAQDVVRLELIQLSYPSGDLLASYEENSRDFLFPTPRISPKYPGVDREVLLIRSDGFPGIAPRLEFSSRTIIKEIHTRNSGLLPKKTESSKITSEAKTSPKKTAKKTPSKSVEFASTTRGRKKQTNVKKLPTKHIPISPDLSFRDDSPTQKRYEQSTISSRARSPSPYTRRRMAQLSINDPFESTVEAKPFKSELEQAPDFTVKRSHKSAPNLHSTSKKKSKPKSNSSKKTSRKKSNLKITEAIKDEDTIPVVASPTKELDSINEILNDQPKSRDLSPSVLPGSILYRTPLRDRYSSGYKTSNEIRDRVRDLLSPSGNSLSYKSYSDSFCTKKYLQGSYTDSLTRKSRRSTPIPRELPPDRSMYLSFDERLDNAYQDIYDDLKNN